MSEDKSLVSVKFGSHLYGTSTPSSDLDIKNVHIPAARDILLQRIKGSIVSRRPKIEGEKNFAGEIEIESYSLGRFLTLASEGQTVSIDVLFAPDWAFIEPATPEWREVIANRHRLITRKSAAFVGYCKQQANKYGIKGSRVAAGRTALALLTNAMDALGSGAKLHALAAQIEPLAPKQEHMSIVDIPHLSGGTERHWEVCGRKLPYSASVKNAHGIIDKLVTQYGQRALLAESQNGVDWKALSHAVRVANEAIELLGTGRVTFPLPNAGHILAIKTGRLLYQKVAEEIEGLLESIEEASARSTLPEQPDVAWIEEFIARCYRDAVVSDAHAR